MTLVGITAAARGLGLDKATVSRYVRDHPGVNRQMIDGKPPLVDVDELREHRARTVDESKSGNRAGMPFGADMNAPFDVGGAGGAGGDGGDANGAPGAMRRGQGGGLEYRNAATADKAIGAKLKQLQLSEKMGQVVARAVVEMAAFEAGQKLQQELAIRNRQLAEQIAVMDNPREIARVLRESDIALLERVADAFSREFTIDAFAAE